MIARESQFLTRAPAKFSFSAAHTRAEWLMFFSGCLSYALHDLLCKFLFSRGANGNLENELSARRVCALLLLYDWL
jgi:hypothetical protein